MAIDLNGASRLFPILGDPVRYARSPQLLTESFLQRGHNAACVPLQVPAGRLDDVMTGLSSTLNVDGLLVTMPHKNDIVRYCGTLSETSRLLGTVSVIRRNPDGSWHGHTQDGDSFVKAQVDRGARLDGASVLLIGAGGAGSAIAISLLSAGIGGLTIYDLDRRRAERLVELLSNSGRRGVRYGPPDPSGIDMVCNATNLGMNDDDDLPLDPALLDSSVFVGDVIAGHGDTPLIKAAKAAGCPTADGDQMVDAVQTMMVDFMLAGSRLG